MFKRLTIVALMSVLLASAKSYTINISDPASAGSVELKAGEYRLKLDGTQVVLIDKAGKQIDTTAKVETAEHKFDQTSISISKADGANRIISIQLGGSTNRVVFE
jgi:hypothetical protein